MKFVVPVTEDGLVDTRWGKAPRLAVATVVNGEVTDWQVHAVGWDVAHDQGTEGSHHARVVRFLQEQGITHVLVDHMGAPMAHTIDKMGLAIVRTPTGVDARTAVTDAANR